MRFFPKIIVFLILVMAAFQTVVRADWVRQDAGTLSWLHDVFFLDQETGWIVGSNGQFLSTIDGGNTWVKGKKFTEDTIRSVYFFDRKSGWLLCDRDRYSLGSDAPSYLLTTEDGGGTWKTVNFTADVRKRITRVFFAGNDFGVAIGESGTILSVVDNKTVWKKLPSPVPYLLNDGFFTTNFRGTVVGGGGTILYTEDAGATWKKAFIAGDERTKLNSVFFLNERLGWTAGENGNIYQTINGGRVWRRQKTSVNADLTGIRFVNTAEGWAIGENGTILHSTTAGNVWTAVESNTRHRLDKILFVGTRGWIVGFGGMLLRFDGKTTDDKAVISLPRNEARN